MTEKARACVCAPYVCMCVTASEAGGECDRPGGEWSERAAHCSDLRLQPEFTQRNNNTGTHWR